MRFLSSVRFATLLVLLASVAHAQQPVTVGNTVTVTGTVTATDGAGALTVDGTVTITDGAGAVNVIVDSGSVTVTDGAGALNVIVDSGAVTATVTDGAGALNVIVDSGTVTADTEMPAAAALADNTANPTLPAVAAYSMCYDGSTWDRCTGAGADTELPSAAALADNTANPTAPGVAAFLMCYDGATWDRCSGTSSDTEMPAAAALADNTSNPTVPGVAAFNMCWDGSTWDRCAAPGSLSLSHRISVGTTEDEFEVKAAAGTLMGLTATNTAATVAFLRCANQVAASTTPGTTTVWWGIAVPGATTGAGIAPSFPVDGIPFSTGLTCWIVTGAAETDVAEVAANVVNVNVYYK